VIYISGSFVLGVVAGFLKTTLNILKHPQMELVDFIGTQTLLGVSNCSLLVHVAEEMGSERVEVGLAEPTCWEFTPDDFRRELLYDVVVPIGYIPP